MFLIIQWASRIKIDRIINIAQFSLENAVTQYIMIEALLIVAAVLNYFLIYF